MADNIIARTFVINGADNGAGSEDSETGNNAGNDSGNQPAKQRRRRIVATPIEQPKRLSPDGFGSGEIEGNGDAETETPLDVRASGAESQKVAAKPTRVTKKTAARKVVANTLDHLNLAVASFVAPGAAMQPHERMMIEPPLQDYAEKHADSFIKGGDSIGPMICVAGVIFWIKRLRDAGHIKLPQPQKIRGYNGPKFAPSFGANGPQTQTETPTGTPPEINEPIREQPLEPIPLYARPVETGYSPTTAAFETITRRG